MTRLPLYARAVSHLRLAQILARVLALGRRKVLHRWGFYTARYRGPGDVADCGSTILFPEEVCNANQHEISHGTFSFLNRRVSLGRPMDWFPADESRLWLYCLHSFDYVLSLGGHYARTGDGEAYELFRRVVAEWIAECSPGTSPAWDTYPLSLRITNWLKAYTLFERSLTEDRSFAAQLRRSLYGQARFLASNVEYDVLGNHLVENGRALLYSGLFFVGSAPERWRRRGEQILWGQLSEQFLDDGGHYERSPMYHQMMLRLYQEASSVLSSRGHVVPEHLKDAVRGMRDWLCAVLHPDGEIPLLNDAARRMAGCPDSLVQGAAAGPEGLKALPDSGYFVFREKSAGHFMIFDCGPLGPDYQPGHGHCDTLSYELSLSGQRIIVDSGVETYYGDLDWRTYYRSTRAHNTVVVDDAEQSEIWGRFRVARRARPLDVRWSDEGLALAYACGSHSGYQRLRRHVVHRRWVCWIDRRFWVVCDRIEGTGSHRLESLIHFHPCVEVISVPRAGLEPQVGELASGQVRLKIAPWGVQTVSTYCGATDPIQGWYAPEFGLRMKNHVWGLHREDELPVWLGYVLWPESTDVALEFSPLDGRSCHVAVESGGVRYHLVISPTVVALEKEL